MNRYKITNKTGSRVIWACSLAHAQKLAKGQKVEEI
jgi:hypothetical protein